MFIVKFFHIGFMLIEIGVQFFILQSQIGFDIIGEFDNVQVYSFSDKHGLDFFQDFSMWYR